MFLMSRGIMPRVSDEGREYGDTEGHGGVVGEIRMRRSCSKQALCVAMDIVHVQRGALKVFTVGGKINVL
jgi:hypothetical protein